MMEKRFYVGTYTINSASEGMYYLSVDFEKKHVSPLQTISMRSPSLLAYSPDHRFLYAVQEFDTDRSLTAFCVKGDGLLVELNSAIAPSIDICHIQVSSDASFLVGSSWAAGFVVSWELNSDGSLGKQITLCQHQGHGPMAEQDIPRAHSAVFDRTGTYLVCADYGNDTIYVYAHKDHGILTEIGKYSVKPGWAPRIVTFSKDNQNVYIIMQNGNVVTHFRFDPQIGSLTQKESVSCIPRGYSQKSEAAEVQFSPDNRFLYASSRGSDTIACYQPQNSGALTLLFVQPCGGSFPRHFTITADGLYLLCGNQHSNTVTVFARNPFDGSLSQTPIFSFDVQCPTFILEADSI